MISSLSCGVQSADVFGFTIKYNPHGIWSRFHLKNENVPIVMDVVTLSMIVTVSELYLVLCKLLRRSGWAKFEVFWTNYFNDT